MSSFDEIVDSLTEILEKRQRCEDLYAHYLRVYDEMLKSLEDLKERSKNNQKRCNIAHVTASSAGIVSGLSILGGLVLAPATLGGSLLFSGGGMVGMVSSSVASVGTMITEEVLKRKSLKETQRLIENYNKVKGELFEAIEEYSNSALDFEERVKVLNANSNKLALFGEVFKTGRFGQQAYQGMNNIWGAYRAAQNAPKLVRLAQTFTKNGARLSVKNVSRIRAAFGGTPLAMSAATRFFQMGLVGVGLAVDTYTLVTKARDLANKNGSEEGFNEVVENLDTEKEDVKKLYEILFVNVDDDGDESDELKYEYFDNSIERCKYPNL